MRKDAQTGSTGIANAALPKSATGSSCSTREARTTTVASTPARTGWLSVWHAPRIRKDPGKSTRTTRSSNRQAMVRMLREIDCQGHILGKTPVKLMSDRGTPKTGTSAVNGRLRHKRSSLSKFVPRSPTRWWWESMDMPLKLCLKAAVDGRASFCRRQTSRMWTAMLCPAGRTLRSCGSARRRLFGPAEEARGNRGVSAEVGRARNPTFAIFAGSERT